MNTEGSADLSLPATWRTVRHAIMEGAQLLHGAGIESGRIDAEALLEHALKCNKTELYLRLDDRLDAESELRFGALLARRRQREPVAYITAHKEFWSMDLCVTSDVLIPRPETERLVEIALALAGGFPSQSGLRILDLGTGSGAIAVSLAKEMNEARVLAIDLSVPALEVARRNAAAHGVAQRVNFVCSDLFAGLSNEKKFHLIVGNPPYIRPGEISMLAPEIRDYEPRIALNGGSDGLAFYRRIVAQGYSYLATGGALVLEIGADLAQTVGELLAVAARYTPAQVHRDYNGSERVVVAHRIRPGRVRGTGKPSAWIR